MNSITGQIVSLEDGFARVDVPSSALCSRCAAGRGCGAGLFGSGSAQQFVDVSLPAVNHFRVGDKVTIGIESSSLLQASWLAYGFPLAGALLFIGLGLITTRPLGDWSAAGLALSGMAAGWLLSRAKLGKPQCARKFRPVLRDIAKPDVSNDF